MRNLLFITLLFCFITSAAGQQVTPEKPAFPQFNMGLGGGIDYGGIGARFTLLPSNRFEFFGAIGYNLLSVGLNAGAAVRLSPSRPICPYIGAMYGYNGVIKVTGLDTYNKTYYGPSFTIGTEFWMKKRPHFLNLEFILPLRSEAYHDAINSLKNNPNIVFTAEPIPVAFSIGYHFIL